MKREPGYYWCKIRKDGVEDWQVKYLSSPSFVNLFSGEQLIEINQTRIGNPDENAKEIDDIKERLSSVNPSQYNMLIVRVPTPTGYITPFSPTPVTRCYNLKGEYFDPKTQSWKREV